MSVTHIQTGKCKGRSCFLQVVVYFWNIIYFSFIFDLLIDSEHCRCFQLIYYLLFMHAIIFICDSIDLSGTLDLQ